MAGHPSFNGMHTIILNNRYLILNADEMLIQDEHFVSLPILHHGELMRIEVPDTYKLDLVVN